MYEIYERLLKARGLTSADVSKATGIRQSTLSTWKKRNATLNIKNAQKIADFLGVSIDYLMGNTPANPDEKDENGYYTDPETARLAQEMFDDPEMRSLFHMKKNMSPEKFKAHMDMMKQLYKIEHPEDNDDFYGC